MVAISRGAYCDDEFTASIATSMEFNLAKADLFKSLVLMPNVSEGGVSISISDRRSLIGLANAIYRKYGEPLIEELHPMVEYIDI